MDGNIASVSDVITDNKVEKSVRIDIYQVNALEYVGVIGSMVSNVKHKPAKEEHESLLENVERAVPYKNLNVYECIKVEYDRANSDNNTDPVVSSSSSKQALRSEERGDEYNKILNKQDKTKHLKCNVCMKTFKYGSCLYRHKRIHSGVKPYECKVCMKKFLDGSSFNRHKRIHSGEKPYECNICMKKFNDWSTCKKHIRIHSGDRRYECNVCTKKFIDRSHLDRHKRTHTGDKPYVCSICFKKFSDSSAFNRHNCSVNVPSNEYEEIVATDRFQARLSGDEGTKNLFMVGTVENDFVNKEHESVAEEHESVTEDHESVSEEHEPPEKEREVLDEDVERAIPNRNAIVCKNIKVKYERTNSEKDTNPLATSCTKQILHSEERGDVEEYSNTPYKQNKTKHLKCNVCIKTFRYESCLYRHKRIHGEKPYECKVCMKKFHDGSSFNRHKRIHSGEKPYECDICMKKFNDLSTCKKHKRIHSDDRRYECNVCTKKFMDRSHLDRHKRTHVEKPYACNNCVKKFSDLSTFNRHKRVHNNENSI